MTIKNTGKPSEKLFDDAWKRLGKVAHVFAFTDASEATGTNKRRTHIKAQPSDRLVTFRGVTWFAEVKSTVHETRFDFSLLRTTQGAYAAMIIAAGGVYYAYVHRLATDVWYRLSYQEIQAVKDAGRASLRWDELEGNRWNFPATT